MIEYNAEQRARISSSLFDAYECLCKGSGKSNDPTLADNAVASAQHRRCAYCEGLGVIYVLKGYEPPRYAGDRIGGIA
jgi:hypothetical protein